MSPEDTSSTRAIRLRGVRVHNLRNVDLDLPSRKLIAFCGVSGSGKSSLALDTLYAEGQRRYIECFSSQARQFFARLERPDADRIEGLPPAIAIRRGDYARASQATIGAVTEIDNYLQLLMARCGRVYCDACDIEVRRDTAATAARRLTDLPSGSRLMIALAVTVDDSESLPGTLASWREQGFPRTVIDGKIRSLTTDVDASAWHFPVQIDIIVDRLVVGDATPARWADSLETALERGGGRCHALLEMPPMDAAPVNAAAVDTARLAPAKTRLIDGRPWRVLPFTTLMECSECRRAFTPPEPRLYSFTSPLGACAECEGSGEVLDYDLELIVPDPKQSIRGGAIAPWSTPAHHGELALLLERAGELDIPVDVPFSRLTAEQVALLRDGDPHRSFPGLRGFFARQGERTPKRDAPSGSPGRSPARWQSPRPCPRCRGSRLREESLAARIGGRHIAALTALPIHEALAFLRDLQLEGDQAPIGAMILEQATTRLAYLAHVGLGYLTLNRPMRTLSGGEAQRVTLTSTLGSNLVNMLYVLDEPSVGLHPTDVDRLLTVVHSLRDRGNTVIVVEHEEALLRAADHVIEVGPAAGERGGQIVFSGTAAAMLNGGSMTGDYLAGRRGLTTSERRRPPGRGWIRLVGARGHNLQHVTVDFPLGVLCLVTGVSGAGKSSLVQDTLYGALCHRKRKAGAAKPLPYDDVFGDGQIDDVMLIDQGPIGRTARSNPVTYVKAFDEIRAVFAETIEARTRNYGPSHFSFNVDGGRCPTCAGEGYLEVDMQFMANVLRKCDQCGGTRYRDEILRVTYRGRSVADVLELTVREAFSFFRGQAKVQQRLKRLMDVGLDYLRLGQPANTLSSGEAQRLKLASFLSTARRNRTLFILDEPTTGLHPSDIVQLLDCFDALLAVGHSLIVVEHNLQLMKAADYIIDLGPGPAAEGGQVVAQGTPEKIAHCASSVTGKVLARVL